MAGTSQYFEPDPAAASRRRTVELVLPDGTLRLQTDRGVFAAAAVDPGTKLLLLEAGSLDDEHRQRLSEYAASGIEVRMADSLPMKLAVFDGRRGMIALLDPVLTRPAWTAVVFDHDGMGQAMQGLFDDHWQRAKSL